MLQKTGYVLSQEKDILLECRHTECKYNKENLCTHERPDISLFVDMTWVCWTDLVTVLEKD